VRFEKRHNMKEEELRIEGVILVVGSTYNHARNTLKAGDKLGRNVRERKKDSWKPGSQRSVLSQKNVESSGMCACMQSLGRLERT
jgi:hypothetical protein